MILRSYQAESIAAMYSAMRDDAEARPLIQIPTGGGKSAIISQVAIDAHKIGARIMVVTHVKELVEQVAEELVNLNPSMATDIGVYSAGLNRREHDAPIVIAGVQSAFKCPERFGHIRCILVDEAHRIPPDGGGMYQTLLAGLRATNPACRLAGLTATPYRLDGGLIYGEAGVFTDVVYRVSTRELIDAGYLSPLKSPDPKIAANMDGAKRVGGDFSGADVEARMLDVLDAAVRDMLERCHDRRSVLVFAPSIVVADAIAAMLREVDETVLTIFGDTPSDDRADAIDLFKRGECQYLINVGVLTTGFNAPNIDCVVLMRATLSRSLYVQMVGRGLRKSPGKADCLVLDYGGNVRRHGILDAPGFDDKKPKEQKGTRERTEPKTKTCSDCLLLFDFELEVCPECGGKPEMTIHINPFADDVDVLSGESQAYRVDRVSYETWLKSGASLDTPRTMRVNYRCGLNIHSEWVCPEHPHGGFARRRFERWWKQRANCPYPQTADDAVAIARAGRLREPGWIKLVFDGSQFPTILCGPLADAENDNDTQEQSGNEPIYARGGYVPQ